MPMGLTEERSMAATATAEAVGIRLETNLPPLDLRLERGCPVTFRVEGYVSLLALDHAATANQK